MWVSDYLAFAVAAGPRWFQYVSGFNSGACELGRLRPPPPRPAPSSEVREPRARKRGAGRVPQVERSYWR